MGIAAYKRGSRALSTAIDRAALPGRLAQIVHDLDEVPHDLDASTPFETEPGLLLSEGHGGWWLSCLITGFGYWYKTPREAFKRWRIYIAAASEHTPTLSGETGLEFICKAKPKG